MTNTVEISKTLSFWLRHKPHDAGLTLDIQGWASVDAVLAALKARAVAQDFDTLLAVVEHNDKQRFELSPDLTRIRARQGHSIDIDLALSPIEPPPLLYHGTVERALAAILADGLKKMRRHHVHLSADLDTARKVGARRGAAVILEIDAASMTRAGELFYRSANGVWLTDAVPARYLRRL